MHLTDHMRKSLLDSVIAAQNEGSPLLAGIDLQRLKTTLERDLSEEELASIMMTVGHNRDESMRAMCLSMIDRSVPSPEPAGQPSPVSARQRGWKVEYPLHRGVLRRLTSRPVTAPLGDRLQSRTA